jgi:ABC-type Fe3+/spermidine/putrescine transport system ATPase subunit
LSGGQQQRVALARALVIKPRVLLLDEPLSNLDAKLRIELRSEIRRICKEAGMTGVYVTHDQKEALSMADRIAVMRAGRIEQVGTPRELYRKPSTRFVAEFMGEANFLDCVVKSKGALDWAGLIVELDSASGEVGTKQTLSVRPEATRLVPRGTSQAINATIEDVVYLGEVAQVRLRLPNGQQLVASALNPGELNRGDELGVVIPPQDLTILRD